MPANPGRVEAINWKLVVAEAMRRRRAEKLTQKEHAELAGGIHSNYSRLRSR
ncbi:hypothetical protein ABID62_008961 [Bradyrhizobium sp. S3.9.1]